MKLYFYGPPTDVEHLRSTYGIIRKILRQAEVELSSNTQTPESSIEVEASQAVQEAGGMLLEMMDGLIIEGSTHDPEVGYLLAYALAQRKPTLFLSERGSSGRQILRYINERQVPKTCQIRTYTQKTLQWLIAEFLKTIDSREVKEIPRIKFTLRITPTIDEFLEWKTRNTKTKKADYLRDEIEKLMKVDREFQNYIRRKRQQIT